MDNTKKQGPLFFLIIKATSDITGKIAGYLCGSLVFVMFLVVALQIVARTVGITISWTEEASRYLLIWVGLLAAGIALKEGGHAAIGFVVDLFSIKFQILIGIFIKLCILGFLLLFFKTGLSSALAAHDILMSSFEMSMVWPKLSIPVGSVVMIVNCLYLIAFDITRLMNGRTEGDRS